MRHPAPQFAIALLFVGATSLAIGGDLADRASCPAAAALPDQIRPSSCRLAETVVAALVRSATFQLLVARIGFLKGIVYVDGGFHVEPNRRRVDGALQHRVTRAGEYRLLHVRVAPESGDRTVLIIAHELQHVVELLESNAVVERDIDALFERIGTPVGAWLFETSAAGQVQEAVARELVQSRR